MAIVLPKFPRHRASAAATAESQPAVNLMLCREDSVYPAGGDLKLRWRIRRINVEKISSVELSVLWRTEGKGDEDLSVHHFQRFGRESLATQDLSVDQAFQCRLPIAPLSYYGTLIRLCWCVRQRVFIDGQKEIMTEVPFYVVSPAMKPLGDEDGNESVDHQTTIDQDDGLTSQKPSRSWLPIKRRV